MPSSSEKQHRFMEMVAHDPKAAKRVGVPVSVGKDFVKADKGTKLASNASKTHGYGHNIGQRAGHLRTSGHSGSHRVGKR